MTRLALDGAVPEDHIELLLTTMTMAAATAGGIRPSVEALIGGEGIEDAMFGLWLGLITILRVVAMALDMTEAEMVEDVLVAVDTGQMVRPPVGGSNTAGESGEE